MALYRTHFATGADFTGSLESAETEDQLAVRMREAVARNKADPRPAMTTEEARSYLDERLATLFGKKAPRLRF